MATATAPSVPSEPSIREKLGVKSATEAIAWLNLLVYGVPGAGKTYLLGTAEDSADLSPFLFIDIEGGTLTIRKRKGIDVVRARSIDEIVKIHNMLYEDAGEYYKGVGIDSITELQKLDMKTIMKKEHENKPETIDPDQATMSAWGKSRIRLTRIIQGFKDLPIHTICTALLHEELDDVNGITKFSPAMSGQLRREIPGYFDVVAYLSAKSKGEEVVRTLQTAMTSKVAAKDRTASLPGVIVGPNLPDIWAMIHSDGASEDTAKKEK